MILESIGVSLGCMAVIGLMTFGRKFVLNKIPMFKDNEFHENDFFDYGDARYDILKMRRETTYEFTYKKLVIMGVISLIPIFNVFYGIFLSLWLLVLVLTDVSLAAMEVLKKFDFWDRKV